eukprot:scaffold329571_cov40-Prasinocladus_malaysianus.AAC.1
MKKSTDANRRGHNVIQFAVDVAASGMSAVTMPLVQSPNCMKFRPKQRKRGDVEEPKRAWRATGGPPRWASPCPPAGPPFRMPDPWPWT